MVEDQLEYTRIAIAELDDHAAVEYAHPNYLVVQRDAHSILSIDRSRGSRGEPEPAKPYIPRPPVVGVEPPWFEQEIFLSEAHAITTGSRFTRIAIIDIGRSPSSSGKHPDLADNWVPDLEYDAKQEARNYTYVNYPHAVGVAGTAAQVCPSCSLLNINAASNDSLPQDIFVFSRAIKWAVDADASVINMSFEFSATGGSCQNVQVLIDAVQYAEANDVVLVAAAGNTGAAQQKSPADCPYVISVAATGEFQELAAYSNRNTATPDNTVRHVDIAAPGGQAVVFDEYFQRTVGCGPVFGSVTDINTGIFVPWTDINGNHCHRYMAGTSFAAPHVAGIAGLMRSLNPSISAADVRNLMNATAQSISCSSGGICGSGLVNAEDAVLAAAPDYPGVSSPLARFSVHCYSGRLWCWFDATQSSSANSIISYQWIFPDNETASGLTTFHFFPGHGQHSVTLRVTDSAGRSSEHSRDINTLPYSTLAPQFGEYVSADMKGNTIDIYINIFDDIQAMWSTYDIDGRPVWYMSENSQIQGSRWSAPILRVTRSGSGVKGVSIEEVGRMTLDFSGSNEAWMSWQFYSGYSSASGYARTGGARFNRTGTTRPASGFYSFAEASASSPSNLGVMVGAPNSQYTSVRLFAYREGAFSDSDGTGDRSPIWLYDEAQTSSTFFTMGMTEGVGLCPGCGGSRDPITRSISGSDYASIDLSLLNQSPTVIRFFSYVNIAFGHMRVFGGSGEGELIRLTHP